MPPSYRTATSSVLVIGTGAAGLRAAIAAMRAGVQARVLGKRPQLDAHRARFRWHQRGPRDARPGGLGEQHFADTLREGYVLGDPRKVEIMARESPDAVRELAAWGCKLARTEDGRLDQRFFGAHRWRRTCDVGDYTGRAILRTVADKVTELAIPSRKTSTSRACSSPTARASAHDGANRSDPRSSGSGGPEQAVY